MIELDNLHYDYSIIDGYNKPFNFIMSPREMGKTSMLWMKIYNGWKRDHRPWIYTTRTCVEITQALIDSIADSIINKFTDDNIQFNYNKGAFKDGIVDVKIDDILFIRIVSLSIQLRRIKLAVLKNIKGVLMDEYIINPKLKERYITNESFIIKEAYTTWRREANGILKWYFLANPYSLFNPLFLDWNVDVSKLKIGSFYVGDNFVIHYGALNPLLKDKLLQLNPLYKFDDSYSDYALNGIAINDKNIQLGTLPRKFNLRYVISLQSRFIGIYATNDYSLSIRFHCKYVDLNELSKNRNVYCFSIEELVERTMVVSNEEKFMLLFFKDAMRTRKVSFEDINIYYLMLEVYKNL